MTEEHNCAGVQISGDNILICVCVTPEMYSELNRHFTDVIRQEVISEIRAFANDYHHHVEGRDVVIVDQLLAFLMPPWKAGNNGLGTT